MHTAYEHELLLKGHQIIGELRLSCLYRLMSSELLKGHQIIGELRPAICFKAAALN